MNEHSRQGPGLFELLGRSWRLTGGIEAVAFSPDMSGVAFTTADGSVALAPVAEAEPPESRIRISSDLGQMRILPRSRPPAPLASLTLESGRPAPLAPLVGASFAVGLQDGAVRRLSAQGELGDALFQGEGPILALDHRGTLAGYTVATDGRTLYVKQGREQPVRTAIGEGDVLGALAISPDSQRIAGLCGQGLAIWTREANALSLSVAALPAQAVSLCWNERSSHVACGLATGGFSIVGAAQGTTHTVMNFPAPVRSVAWSRPANALVASGAYRIAAWLQHDGMAGEAIVTGRPGLVPVEVVAARPSRDLIAAGYGDGRIVVAQLRSTDELLVRPGGAPVSALAWSSDGRHLAVGDAEGGAAILTFPPQIFK